MNIKVSVVGLLLFFPGCDAQQNATNSAPAPAPATTARTVVKPTADSNAEWSRIVEYMETAAPKRDWILNCESDIGLDYKHIQADGTYVDSWTDASQGRNDRGTRSIVPGIANYSVLPINNVATLDWRVRNMNYAFSDSRQLLGRKEFQELRFTLLFDGVWKVAKVEEKAWEDKESPPAEYTVTQKNSYRDFMKKAVNSALD